ncbi:hypothetical protein BC628DRAFT_1073754 [Trametes gibbosa]|nr:hypothetical protein BC628DRAFT_1073754 [Trametes gibbosa]
MTMTIVGAHDAGAGGGGGAGSQLRESLLRGTEHSRAPRVGCWCASCGVEYWRRQGLRREELLLGRSTEPRLDFVEGGGEGEGGACTYTIVYPSDVKLPGGAPYAANHSAIRRMRYHGRLPLPFVRSRTGVVLVNHSTSSHARDIRPLRARNARVCITLARYGKPARGHAEVATRIRTSARALLLPRHGMLALPFRADAWSLTRFCFLCVFFLIKKRI